MSSAPAPSSVAVVPADRAAEREATAAPAISAGLRRSDLVITLVTVLAWGSLHPLGKLTLAEITTSQLSFMRVGLALVFLVGVCAVTGRLTRLLAALHPGRIGGVVVLGLTGFTLSGWLSMTSLGYLPAGINSLLANASPLLVAFATAVLVRERPDWRTVVGVVVGFVGVALVALRGGVDASGLSVLGVTLSLFGAACWAIYTTLARRLMAGQDTLVMGAAMALVGAVPLGILTWLEDGFGQLLAASSQTDLMLLWCGVVATGATYTTWVYLLKRIHAARVASFQYLIPLFALILAYPIVGEAPTPIVLAGAVLIIGGVATANSRRGR